MTQWRGWLEAVHDRPHGRTGSGRLWAAITALGDKAAPHMVNDWLRANGQPLVLEHGTWSDDLQAIRAVIDDDRETPVRSSFGNPYSEPDLNMDYIAIAAAALLLIAAGVVVAKSISPRPSAESSTNRAPTPSRSTRKSSRHLVLRIAGKDWLSAGGASAISGAVVADWLRGADHWACKDETGTEELVAKLKIETPVPAAVGPLSWVLVVFELPDGTATTTAGATADSIEAIASLRVREAAVFTDSAGLEAFRS